MTTSNASTTEIKLHIEVDKISKYLLDPDHVDGGPKCALFLHFGFSTDKPQELANSLFGHAHRLIGSGSEFVPGSFGPKLTCSGDLMTPCGRNAWATSVWAIEGTDPLTLRLITAYIHTPPAEANENEPAT